MAEWKQVQKAQWVHEAGIFQVRPNLRLEWRDIAENIAMRDHYPFGLGGGAGGENNLQRVIRTDFFGVERLR